MNELLALGLSHKTAPLELRERLALTEGSAAGALRELIGAAGIGEAAAISTCNRTEIYLVASDAVAAESTALSILTRRAELRPTELVGSLYSLRDEEAARHLLGVTAGLDSMILGEAEIQGQVKRAYELALVEGTTGPILNRLFRGALSAGGRIRAETAIGRGRVSIPSLAVEEARRSLGNLAEREVLVVGAGETAELLAAALSRGGAAAAFVANRHRDRAVALAGRHGGEAVPIEELSERLARADVVFTATNSPHHVIESEDLEVALGRRGGRPLHVIDIAVPRDVDPAARRLGDVHMLDIDDLQRVAERNAGLREAEARRAEAVIAAELERFEAWVASLEVVPTIAALRELGDEVADRVLAENGGYLGRLESEERERIETIARAVAGRLLHEPTVRMRRAAGEDSATLYAAVLRDLFGLDVETEPEGEVGGSVTELRRRDA